MLFLLKPRLSLILLIVPEKPKSIFKKRLTLITLTVLLKVILFSPKFQVSLLGSVEFS